MPNVHQIHLKYADYLALIPDMPVFAYTARAEIAEIPVSFYVGAEPGVPARFVVNEVNGSMEFWFSEENAHEPAVYLHEVGHAITHMLHPTVEPGGRAEVAAWAVVYSILIEARGGPLHAPLSASLFRVAMAGSKDQRVNMGLGKLCAENIVCRLDMLIDTILNTEYDPEDVGGCLGD